MKARIFNGFEVLAAVLKDQVILSLNVLLTMGRDSSVGIATRYGLDGPGIESRLGRDFPDPF